MLRRFIRSLILPTTLIAVLLLGLFTAMDYFAALEQAERPAPELEAAPPPPAPTTDESTQKTERPAARGVAPGLVGPPADPGRLTRIAPREPLTPPEEREAKPERTLLHRPLAESAGLLSFGGRNLRVSGIEPTPADRFCPSADGGRWPCGMIARTAFRNYLRGRSLDCDVEDAEWRDTIDAQCLMLEADIGLWLAENGWAEATPGSPYAEANAEAKEAGLGIFGTDPR